MLQADIALETAAAEALAERWGGFEGQEHVAQGLMAPVMQHHNEEQYPVDEQHLLDNMQHHNECELQQTTAGMAHEKPETERDDCQEGASQDEEDPREGREQQLHDTAASDVEQQEQ